MGHLDGMKILVTGGARGVGLAVAEALAKEGAQFCITGRDEGRLQQAKASLQAQGATVETRAFDVTRREECFAAVSDLAQRWGRIDALVNNSGIYKASPFLQFDPADFEALFRTNVMGCIHLMQAVLPQMVSQRSGRILNVASIAGKWGSLNQSAYNISKHALVGLTRSVALEMARHGVTVNAICPGLVDTEMAKELVDGHAKFSGTDSESMMATILGRIPLGRLVKPDEIGALAAYMLSPAASGMTGQSIVYDGGVLQV